MSVYRARPYHWEWENYVVDEVRTQIRAWALTEDNEPCLLRFDNYAIPCHILLNKQSSYTRVNNNWKVQEAKAVYNHLAGRLDLGSLVPFKPHHLQPMKPLYGIQVPDDIKATGDELLQMIRNNEIGNENILIVYAKSFKTIAALKSLVRYPLVINMSGYNLRVRASLMMAEFEPTDKLLTQLEIGHCQWLQFEAVIPSEANKISSLNQEYIVDITSVQAIPEEEAKFLTTNPWVFSFDIECNTPNYNKFPDLWDPDCPIEVISCSLARADGTETRTWSLVNGTDATKEVLDRCKRKENTIICCDDEIGLIAETCALIRDYDPEVITGFNLAFDIEYMNARLVANLVSWPYMSRLKPVINGKEREITVKVEVWDSKAYKNMKIAHFMGLHGRIVMDVYLEVYRNNRFPRYNLNYVANHYLGVGKVPLAYREMFRLLDVHKKGLHAEVGSDEYNEGISAIKKVIEYCDEDSNLCTRLFATLKMWDNSIECSNIMCVNIYAFNTRGQQTRCIQMLYREAIANNYFINSRPTVQMLYEGGRVQEPEPGTYGNTQIIDFNSLYPSIIQAHNVCYTTQISQALYKKIPAEACEIRTVTCSNKDDEDTYDFRWIKSEYREGLLPRMVRRLCIKRKAVQEEMRNTEDQKYKAILDKRQNAYKVACNSIYGFTGAAKLPLKEAAVAVTAWGRDYITQTSEFIQSKWDAFQIYGDTDSLMFTTPQHVKSSADCNNVINLICDEVTALFPDAIVMKPEYCGFMFSIKKKKYIIWIYKKNGYYDYCLSDELVAEAIHTKLKPLIEESHYEEVYNCIFDYVRTLGSHIRLAEGVLALKINAICGTQLSWKDADYLVIPYIKKSIRGVLSARRDNCKWASQTYNDLLDYIMAGASAVESILFLVERIRLIITGQISHRELLINKSINASYKQQNAAMKIFGDRMRALDKVIEAGERLDYLVVEGKGYLGERMLLEDVYLQSLELEEPYKIDYLYYIEKTIQKQIDNLMIVAYETELFRMKRRISFGVARAHVSIITPIHMMAKMLRASCTLDDFVALLQEQ